MLLMGTRLRELRQGRFLSLRDLADSAGVGYVTIYRLEHDKQRATFRTLRKLAAALGVEPGELVMREE